MFDDDAPPSRPILVQPVLEPLGLEDLAAYIGSLRKEIARAEAEIERKKAHRDTAAAVFRQAQ